MSEADKLFEKLGYEKVYDGECGVGYKASNLYRVYFYYKDKSISISFDNCPGGYISVEKLKAINMKVKELGWE